MRHKANLVVLAVLCAITCVDIHAQTIDSLLKTRIAERHCPSIVVAVVDESGTKFFGSGKTSTLKNAGAANQHTVYEIGSITKVFTGILLAEAVKRGEVNLDDPISKYLPQGVATPNYKGKEITLISLIWHVSGLPFKPDNLNPKDPANPWADYSVERLYDFLARYQLPREPPAQFDYRSFGYSNLGVGLLGHILSRRANMSYEDLVKARILKPLGMDDTAITLSPRLKNRLAIGYNADGDLTPNWDSPVLEGGMGLRSTAADMAKFISANLGFTSANGVALTEARRLTWNKGTIAGGKIIYEKNNLLYHGGSTGGYISFIVIDTERRKGVFVVSNSQGAVEDLAFHIADSTFPIKPAVAPKKEISLGEEVLEKYVGEYRLPALNLTFTISRSGRRLFLQQPGEAKAGLFAETETQFFLKVVEATITFTMDNEGRAMGLVLHQKGEHIGNKIR